MLKNLWRKFKRDAIDSPFWILYWLLTCFILFMLGTHVLAVGIAGLCVLFIGIAVFLAVIFN
jgi:hypothetical protein